MSMTRIDLRAESSALRRVTLLLDRLRQDGHDADPELNAVRSGVEILDRAASTGRTIARTAVQQVERLVAANRQAPARCSHTLACGLLRRSVVVEMDELLRRLIGR